MSKRSWPGELPGIRSSLVLVLAVSMALLGATATVATPAHVAGRVVLAGAILERGPSHTVTSQASADTGGYPYAGAVDCSAQYGIYSWCVNGYDLSPSGYGYRNCTDYVAWKIQQVFGTKLPKTLGNANTWGPRLKADGYHYDSTPQVGDIAVWNTGGGGFGHVAYVYAVTNGIASLDEYNVAGTGLFTSNRTTSASSAGAPSEFVHIGTVQPPPPPPPSAPGPIVALIHGSRVNLKWGAAAGATGYQVLRDGVQLATVTDPTYLDDQVSPNQAYTYSVAASNAAGSSAAVTLYVQTSFEAADRAYLSTKFGPAECGRAGDQTHQYLVCNVQEPSGWVSSYSAPDDWGYASDRAWLVNTDGTISYCRRVGAGDQLLCDRFDGTNWTTSMSPHYDLGYPDTFG